MFHALLHPTKNGLFPSASTSLQVETFIPAAVRQLFSCLYLLEPYGPLGKERKDQIEGEERTFGSEINKHSNKERKEEIESEGDKNENEHIYRQREKELDGVDGEISSASAKSSKEYKSRRNDGDLHAEETESRSRYLSVFYKFISKAMCDAVERLKTLSMESNDVTSFLSTHQLLQICDPVLIIICYPFDMDFSSTSFSSLFSSSSLSLRHSPSSSSSVNSQPFGSLSVTAKNFYLQSAAYSILEEIASMPKNVPPDQIDLIDLAMQAVIDLELPFISPSYFSTITNSSHDNEYGTTSISTSPFSSISSSASSISSSSSSSSSISCNSKNVLSASVSERTILAVLTQSVKYQGISLLEKFSSQIIQKILGPEGWNFLIHGEGFSNCVLLAKKNYFSNHFKNEKVCSEDKKCFQVLLKLVFMILNTILEDLYGLKNISNEILPYIVQYFLPIFCDNKDSINDITSNEKEMERKKENGKPFGQSTQNNNNSNKNENNNYSSNDNNGKNFLEIENSLLRLTKIDSSLQSQSRNKTLHSTLIANTIQILKFSKKSTFTQITSALESLPYILAGFSFDSPRPLGMYFDDPTIVSQVSLFRSEK